MGGFWTRLLEWCAESLGATDGLAEPSPLPASKRLRRLLFYAAAALCAAAGVALEARHGVKGLLPCAALFALAIAATREVLVARAALWRAACLGLDEPLQRPGDAPAPWFAPPTARSLRALTLALDAARRGRYDRALEQLPHIERTALRADEARLLDAARALLSLGLGDPTRAAQQAVAALPTGSEALDAQLGRVVLTEAWSRPSQLEALHRAWRDAGPEGVVSEVLVRLARLSWLRLTPSGVETLQPAEARALSREARAVGDEDLAATLDARARGSAYR